MIRIPAFTVGTFICFFLGFLVAVLGWNMEVTWYIHRNGFHEADIFFNFYTQTAEWFIILLALLVAFYANRRLGWIFISLASIQGILVWGIKRWINAPRPASISMDQIREIPGVNLQFWNSFPSGHTAIAVLCYGFLVLSLTILLQKNNKVIEYSGLYLAIAMGYSRMYLGQHSLMDVSIGGLLALFFLQGSIWIWNKSQAKIAN